MPNWKKVITSGSAAVLSDLTLSGVTQPEIKFNGSSDAGVDFAIRATPEGLDFYEPEDGNKIHMQIIDDGGVDAKYGLKINGTSVLSSGRALQNVSGNISMFTNNSGYKTTFRTVTAGGNTLGANETLAFSAGSNVSISESGGTVTISSTDTNTNTTYSAGNGIGLSGTTFSVSAGTGLSQTSSGLALATAGAGAATYGSTSDGTKIDTITLDAYGRVTAVATGATGDIHGVTAGTGLSGGSTSGTATLNLSHLGLESLTDPNDDRIAFWDDSEGAFGWLDAGSNISISGTTISSTDTNTQLSTSQVRAKFSAGENVTISNGVISSTDTNTDTNTVTSIRRDNTGTYRTGNINLVGGTNVTISETSTGVFNISSTDTNTDTNTTYSPGALLDLSGTTFNVDLSELTDMTQAFVKSTDEFVVLDSGVQKRKLASEIFGNNAFNSTAFATGDNFDNDGTFASLRAQGTTKGDVGLGNVANESRATILGGNLTGTINSVAVATVTAGAAAGATANQDSTSTIRSGTTKSNVGLSNVTNESKATMFSSAALTGNPTAPTQTAGNDSTRIATTAFVGTAIDNLIGGAPGTLDTLDEIAAALNDDNDLHGTLTTSIASKLPKSGGTMTGAIAMGNQNITGVNNLAFADPGPNEGLSWSGGNMKLYESPNDLTTNTAGNLQIVYGTTRRLTIDNTGINVNGNATLSGFVLDGNTITGVDDSGEFTDNDAHIMTSAGVDDRISSRISGLTSNAGTMTGITINTATGLDGAGTLSGTGGTINLSLDLSELTDMTGGIDTGVDELILLDNGAERRKRFAEIFGSNAYNSTTIPTNNNQLDNGAGYITDGNTGWNNTYGFTTNTGTVTSVSTGTGLDGSFTTSGTITLDLSELTDKTDAIDASVDEIIMLDNGAERRKRFSEIFGSNAYNSTTIPSAANNATITITAGNALTTGGNFTTNQGSNETITIHHEDTSTQASSNNSNGTVIQDVTLDTYGHVTGLGTYNLDGRYFTETESDARFLGISAKAADSNLLDGLDLHTGRNNVANRVVRTDGNGYANFGWINTTSGNTTSTITDVYVNTNDGYIRKASKSEFQSQMGIQTLNSNTDVDTGTETVMSVDDASIGIFFDYVVSNGTNLRAGTVTAVHDGTNVEFTETSTNDLGDTSDLVLSVDLNGGNVRLLATAASNNWSVKTIARLI
jgi:hypothetical protein